MKKIRYGIYLILFFMILFFINFYKVFAFEKKDTVYIKKVIISGNYTIKKSEILKYLKLKEKAKYEIKLLLSIRKRLFDWGYFRNVKVHFKRDPDGVIVNIKLTENPPVKEIVIMDFDKKPAYILKNELKLKEGKAFNKVFLEKDLERLRRLPYVVKVAAETKYEKNQLKIVIYIKKTVITNLMLHFYKNFDFALSIENFSLFFLNFNPGILITFDSSLRFSNSQTFIISPFTFISFFNNYNFYLFFQGYWDANREINKMTFSYGIYYQYENKKRKKEIIDFSGLLYYKFYTFKLNLFTTIENKYYNFNLILKSDYSLYEKKFIIDSNSWVYNYFTIDDTEFFKLPALNILYDFYFLRGINLSTLNNINKISKYGFSFSTNLILKLGYIEFFEIGIFTGFDGAFINNKFYSTLGAGVYINFDLKPIFEIPFVIAVFTDNQLFFETYTVIIDLGSRRI